MRRCALLVLLLAAACRSVDVAPLGVDPVRANDEQALWEESKRFDERIEASGMLLRDPALQTYLERVAHAVLAQMPSPPGTEVRVFVLRQAMINALASPRGTIVLHTGILARIENEAELATLFGHELAHFVNRHALREQRLRWNQETRSNLAIGLAAILLLNPGLYSAISPSQDLIERQVTGYARELELEADRSGFEAMRAAGYDVRQSVRLFEVVLLDEQEPEFADPYYYADHPSMEQRAAHYRELIAATRDSGEIVEATRYMEAVTAVIEQNVSDDLALARVRSARLGIDRLLARPEPSAQAHFLLGEWLRLSGGTAQLPSAELAYAEATRRDPGHALAWRALGLAQRDRGLREEAARSLARSLELAPDAPDRAILQSYLRELSAAEP